MTLLVIGVIIVFTGYMLAIVNFLGSGASLFKNPQNSLESSFWGLFVRHGILIIFILAGKLLIVLGLISILL